MTAAHTDEERFSYALVSAVPLQDASATGIGIIFKAQDRSTVGTIRQVLDTTDVAAAAYTAVLRVLDEALAGGVGRPTIYLDNAEVVAQLEGEQPVPPELRGINLRTRAAMNQVGRPKIVAARASSRFSARRLALSAQQDELEPPTSPPDQLSLLPDDKSG